LIQILNITFGLGVDKLKYLETTCINFDFNTLYFKKNIGLISIISIKIVMFRRCYLRNKRFNSYRGKLYTIHTNHNVLENIMLQNT